MFDSIHWHIYGFTGVVDEVTGFGIIGNILGDMRVEPSVIPTVAAIAYVTLIIIAYFIGNISPSILLAKSKGMDIKKEGSGNAGTTNALRVMGVKAGIITLVIDILKGVATVLLAELIAGEACGRYCAVAVIIGHIWPVVYKFKGGKGVATTFGALMAINPILGLLSLAVVAIFVLISKRMSVGSIAGAICFPVICLFNEPEFIVMGTLLAIIILIKHRANIVRLLEGNEPKLSFFDKEKRDEDAAETASPAEPEPEQSESKENTAAGESEPVQSESESETTVELESEQCESETETAAAAESEPQEFEASNTAETEPEPDEIEADNTAETEPEPQGAESEKTEVIKSETDDEVAETEEIKTEVVNEEDINAEDIKSDGKDKVDCVDKKETANSRKSQNRSTNNKKSGTSKNGTKKNGKKKKSYPNKKKNGTKPKNQRGGKGGGRKNVQSNKSKSKGNRNNNKKKSSGKK